MSEHSESGTMITGEDIATYRTLVIRRSLILEIDTGMRLTRRSGLSVARDSGITGKRTRRSALKDVNAWLLGRGVRPVWSKTYPTG